MQSGVTRIDCERHGVVFGHGHCSEPRDRCRSQQRQITRQQKPPTVAYILQQGVEPTQRAAVGLHVAQARQHVQRVWHRLALA